MTFGSAAHADGREAAEGPEPHVATELVLRALTLLGVNYKMGGNSPDSGLDCSGLVRHVFQEAVGLVLPRRADEISRAGEAVDTEQLKPGDLVFFNTLRRAFSHVGIYIGNNQFVHAPSRGGGVRVENMDKAYWTQRFNGARRLLLADGGMDARLTAASLGPALPAARAPAAPNVPSLPLSGAPLQRAGAPEMLGSPHLF